MGIALLHPFYGTVETPLTEEAASG